MQKRVPFIATIVALFALGAAVPQSSHAGAYAGNKCIGSKQKAAAAKCAARLKAWSSFDKTGDATKRGDAFTAAAGKFSAAWSKAETKAADKSADCVDTTLSASAMEALIDAATDAIAGDVNNGLNLGDKDSASCGAAILKAASRKCSAFLKAEASYIQKLAAGKGKRNDAKTKASGKFSDAFAKAIVGGCSTAATAPTVEASVDALVDDVVTNTTISPNVDDTQFTVISPTGTVEYDGKSYTPICGPGTPYHYFVKKGTVNKLLMYYQGGGACWDYNTCGLVGTYDKSVIPNGTCSGGSVGTPNNGELCDTLADCPNQSAGAACNPDFDNPNNVHTGFADQTNPNNPFKDWTIVFTAYCTGDIHFGDAERDYVAGIGQAVKVFHFGYQDARVVEKWAREHFVNPDEVFVTGSSAGSYGAFFNAPLLEAVWPDSKFSVLGDGHNGVITNDFLVNDFPTWNFAKNLPSYIPGLKDTLTNGTGIPGYTKVVSAFFPDTAWAHYSTAYDGSTGGQTGFYNIMLNLHQPITTWLTWWNATCAFHDKMRQQAVDTYAAIHATAADNYRYYIGRGSRHTMFGSDTVAYSDDAIGTTPNVAGWINSMRNRDLGWTNVECTDCETLLPGDPQPSPLEDPFFASGPDVVIDCTP